MGSRSRARGHGHAPLNSRLRLARDLLTVVALVFIAWAWFFAVRFVADDGIARAAIDAHAYWSVDSANLYQGAIVGDLNAFLYSPAAGQILDPVSVLPWPVFYGLWLAMLIGCLLYLVGPIPAALLLAVPVVWADVTTGNIHLLLAVAIVVGFRYPAAWAAIVLTKVTPGIGLIWFAVRREWGLLAVALGATAILMLISFAVAPDAWSTWVQVLTSNASVPPRLLALPLTVRLAAAIALVIAGGLTGRRWTVPVAAMLALPILWENSLTMLAAVVPMLGWRWLESLRCWPWLMALDRAKRWPGNPSTDAVGS